MITAAAEQLVADFAGPRTNLIGPYELALVEFALWKLADPRSPYGPLQVCIVGICVDGEQRDEVEDTKGNKGKPTHDKGTPHEH